MQMADEASRKKSEPKPKLKRMLDLDHSDFNELTGKRDESLLFKTDIQKELATSEMVPNLEQLKDLPSITRKKQRELNRVKPGLSYDNFIYKNYPDEIFDIIRLFPRGIGYSALAILFETFLTSNDSPKVKQIYRKCFSRCNLSGCC